MKKNVHALVSIALLVVGLNRAVSQDVRIDFSGATAEQNKITVTGPDFGRLPQAEVSFGAVPVDPSFGDATDGRGLILVAEPGEGVMIQGRAVSTPHAAVLRCAVRTDSPEALVTIAALDAGTDQYVATNGPANGSTFVNRYRRLSVLFTPPTTGFTPILQIVNKSEIDTLTAYVDRLDVHLLKPGEYYASEFLDGDETDPAPLSIVPTSGCLNPDTGLHEITVPLPGLPADAKPLTFVLIPPGTFRMGCPEDKRNYVGREWIPHQVTITKPFYLGKYEITQAQWEAVIGNNPAAEYGVGQDYPVYNVSWNDCREFIRKLNSTGSGTYRLPTEAEWEYACRVGTTTRFFFGDALESDDECEFDELLDRYMWWCGNASPLGAKQVGRKQPNPWGLYDVHGNVWEFCSDWYEDPVDRGAQVNPQGPDSGEFRVIRGGHWANKAQYCRSALRSGVEVDTRSVYIGLRLVKRFP